MAEILILEINGDQRLPPMFLLKHLLDLGIKAYNKKQKTNFEIKNASFRSVEDWEVAFYEFTQKLSSKILDGASDKIYQHEKENNHDRDRKYD